MADTQLDRLKRRIPSETSEPLLQDMLDAAEGLILSLITPTVLPESLYWLQIEIADAKHGKVMAAGVKSQTVGGVSITYDSMPEDWKAAINRYRVAKVGW